MKMTLTALSAVTALLLTATAAQAQIRITEVAPWGSGNGQGYAADWFELTNTGSSAVSIAGWKVDDSSNSFASALALNGISAIAPGESVIFLEGNAAKVTSFISTWFGGSKPAGLQIGFYSGSGIGLSTDGDAVNIFNAAGVRQASVSFGASDGSAPYQSFDNAAGANGMAISTLSVLGTHGAFAAVNNAGEIGSPGLIAAAVPEPSSYALLLGGLGLIALARGRKSERKDA